MKKLIAVLAFAALSYGAVVQVTSEFYLCDLLSERSTSWPQNVIVKVAEDGKSYRLIGASFLEVASIIVPVVGSSGGGGMTSHGNEYHTSTFITNSYHDGTKRDTIAHDTTGFGALQTAIDGKAAASHYHGEGDITGLTTDLAGKSNTGHYHAIADVTSLQTTLDGKLSTSGTAADVNVSGTNISGALNGKEPSLGNPGTNGYVLSSTTSGTRSWIANGGGSMVYPGAGVAVSTGSAWGTSLTAPTYIMNNPLTTIGDLLVANSTATPAATTRLAAGIAGSVLIGNGSATAPTWSNGPLQSYRSLLEVAGSHIAAKVAGTYAIGYGDPLAISGTGTLYPIGLIHIIAADYPTVGTVTTKLRVRATVAVNATAPTGNFTVGLYPVTSGGGAAGLKIYTMGTLVSGSATTTVSAPAANSMTSVNGSDFALPSDGVYCLAVVTTATVATSSLVHVLAKLQMRNQ